MNSEILPDIQKEGFRVVDSAQEINLNTRLIGGLGVSAHDHRELPKALDRIFGDIDLVIGRKAGSQFTDFLVGLGYQPDKGFNALHGASRLLFYDAINQRQVDVFVNEFKMCHSISLDKYLDVHPRSLSPEHLLLTKLQIIEINRKDMLDVLRILYMHPMGVGDLDCPGISVARMNLVLANDWGWYTTVSDNLIKIYEFSDAALESAASKEVKETISKLQSEIEAAPKSGKWRARALVGRRKSWFETPEEVKGEK